MIHAANLANTLPLVGGLIALVDATTPWQEVGVVAMLCWILWSVVQSVISKKAGTDLPAFIDNHAQHDKLVERIEMKLDTLTDLHKDPRSLVSTYFLNAKVERLIELQKESVNLQRQLLAAISRWPIRGTQDELDDES